MNLANVGFRVRTHGRAALSRILTTDEQIKKKRKELKHDIKGKLCEARVYVINRNMYSQAYEKYLEGVKLIIKLISETGYSSEGWLGKQIALGYIRKAERAIKQMRLLESETPALAYEYPLGHPERGMNSKVREMVTQEIAKLRELITNKPEPAVQVEEIER